MVIHLNHLNKKLINGLKKTFNTYESKTTN